MKLSFFFFRFNMMEFPNPIINVNANEDNDFNPLFAVRSPLPRRRRSSGFSAASVDNCEISFEEVSAAAYRIRSGVLRTPCTVSIYRQISTILTFWLVRDYIIRCWPNLGSIIFCKNITHLRNQYYLFCLTNFNYPIP